MEYTWRDEAGVEGVRTGSVIVSSFPSAGLATTVAGHYIIRALKLPRVARFDSPDLSPIAVVQGGVVHPTIRVYGQKDFSLVLSEFPPTPSQATAIARTILDTAERRGSRLIVCLEGVVPHPAEEDEDAAADADGAGEQVWAAYSRRDPDLLTSFAPTRARLLEEGVIGGVSGALLVHGIGRSPRVGVLLVSARAAEGLPDHRAGALLIEALDRLLPELKIDTGPLRQQAEQIERMLRTAMKGRSPAPPAPEAEESSAPGMYG
jgi:predicted ATP-grasp superfamily ATP-dependent carboligase